MPQNKGQYLTLQDRCVIDDGLRDGLSCREIARRVHVQPSTVSREVASNRTLSPSVRKGQTDDERCTMRDSLRELCELSGGYYDPRYPFYPKGGVV